MARAKKDGHFLNCYIKQKVWEDLDRYSKNSMIPKTSLVEKALEEYLKKHISQEQRKVSDTQ